MQLGADVKWARYSCGDLKAAASALKEAVKVGPETPEGIKLLAEAECFEKAAQARREAGKCWDQKQNTKADKWYFLGKNYSDLASGQYGDMGPEGLQEIKHELDQELRALSGDRTWMEYGWSFFSSK